jgi:chitinase
MADNNTSNDIDSSPEVCHVDFNSQDGDAQHIDANLDYNRLLFVDMDGNLVDGRTCGVIYEDQRSDSQVRIVIDEDGNMVDMYMDDAGLWHGEEPRESPVTVAAEPVITITATTRAARPASGKLSPSFLASTTATPTKSGTVVTPAPF